MKKTLFFILSFCFDRLSKHITFIYRDLLLNETIVIPKILSLKYIENRGISFGLFNGNIALTVVVPIVLTITLFYIFHKLKNQKIEIAFLILLGAFLGNLYDRLIHGFVIDMIYFPLLPFFVCNIADILIFLSSIYIVFILITNKEIK